MFELLLKHNALVRFGEKSYNSPGYHVKYSNN